MHRRFQYQPIGKVQVPAVEPELKNLVQTRIPTRHGEFTLHYYSNNIDNKEHVAFVKGKVAGLQNVPVRMHSECFTGDVLGSRRCDCGEQLDMALQLIDEAGYGVLIYLRQEGRGIGLLKKLQAYNLQDQGLDTVDANIHLGHLPDEREYSVAALMLKDLQVDSIRLITNNPSKIDELKRLGVRVEDRIPIESDYHHDNLDYLKAKADKMSHMLSFTSTTADSIPSELDFIKPLLAQLDQQLNQAHKPFVTLSYSQNADGSVGDDNLAFEATQLSQILRTHHDAVLFNIGTLLIRGPNSNSGDDPSNVLQTVIIDSDLLIVEHTDLLASFRKPPIIFTSGQALARSNEQLTQLLLQGINVFSIAEKAQDQLNLESMLAQLTQLNINKLLVESDRQTTQQILDRALFDYRLISINPKQNDNLRIIERLCKPIGNLDYQKLDSTLVVYGAASNKE